MPSDPAVEETPGGGGLRDSVRFFGRFLTSPGSIGAVMPSSRYLAEAMVRGLGLEEGDLVVEYGPGTGPMTLAIHQLKLADLGIGYLGIELDPTFHASLQERFPGMGFVLGSVVDVEAILAERGLGAAKAIISGLPFASLTMPVQQAVVAGTHRVLADDGEFRTFQYVHAFGLSSARRFRAMMGERFGSYHRSTPVLRNVPPAYILTYRK